MFEHTFSEKHSALRHSRLKPPPGSRIVVQPTNDGGVRLSWTAPTLRGGTLGCGIPFLGVWSLFILGLAGFYAHLLLTTKLAWWEHLILLGLIGGMAWIAGFVLRAMIRLARADPESVVLGCDTLTHAPGIAAEHFDGWHSPYPEAQVAGEGSVWQPRPGPNLPYTTADIPRAAVGPVRFCKIINRIGATTSAARTALLVQVGEEHREFGYCLYPQDLIWLADVLRAWLESPAGPEGRAGQ
jgi:hypothetical protein